jgi:hypothetical protein
MDPKLTELFNQMRLTFEHFAEAFDQANPPAAAPLPGSPSDAAVQTGPAVAPGPGPEDQMNPEAMTDEQIDDKLGDKKRTMKM